MQKADELAAALSLANHPEGGRFRELHRSPAMVTHPIHGAARAASTAIYFHLAAAEFSAWHEVVSEELWIHLAGADLELHLISPDGVHTVRLLTRGGASPSMVECVPAGWLQAARPVPGAADGVLVSCVVAPGFDFADFAMPPRASLLRRHPQLADAITLLTRP